MTSVFNNLLVTSPNGGGIFFVHAGVVQKLDALDSTGLSVHGRRVLRGVQPSLVVLYQGTPTDINPTDIPFGDVHDVLIDGDSFYLVGTQGNEVVRFDASAIEEERWTLPGEDDSWHVNCLTKWNGRLVFSAFGEFSLHREYKGAPKEQGFVQDLHTGERLVTGLSQPHSLFPVGEHLLVANSGEMELREYTADGSLLRSATFDGYVRGVCASGGCLFVGLSKSRNLPQAEAQTASLVALDAESWDEIGRLSLPVSEIYGIQAVEPEEVPHVVAAIAAHSSAILSSIISGKVERIQQLGSELQRLEGEAGSLRGALDQVSTVESRLLTAIAEREKVAEVRQASTFAQSLDVLAVTVAAARDELREGQARQTCSLLSSVADLGDMARNMHAALMDRLDQSADLQARIASLGGENTRLKDENTRLKDESTRLEGEVATATDALSAGADRIRELKETVHGLESSLAVRAEALDVLRRDYASTEGELEASRQRVGGLEAELALVYRSRSMRLTRPLRSAGEVARRVVASGGPGIRACVHLLGRPGRYIGLARGKSVREVLALGRGFLRRGGPQPVAPEPARFDLRSSAGPIAILTTRHCEYIARGMQAALERVGIASGIIFERPAEGYADVPHFVICPQMFDTLPGFYVAFQMEQSVSSRWFTEDYLRRLENSYAIFDYSTRNISFLKEKGLSLKQVYYLPVGHLPGLTDSLPPAEEAVDYDIVFYGDANNERRQAYLAELRKHCRVRVVSEVFGEDLYRILSGAKLVVNIHYYAGALLETTRVWECLSLGKLVVSERSTDMEDHGELEGLVDFVDIDDVPAMVRRVRYWLEDDARRKERIRANEAALAGSFNRFDYFFYRFMLATDNISFDEFWREAGHRYRLESDRLCLNLPEYTERSRDFARDNHYGFTLFPGLRHAKGWVGCAMSYKYMIMLAREHGLDGVMICEDDVEFPPDFVEACASINAYLAKPGVRWDIFSGLMADLHPGAKILAVDEHEGRTFATTNRLISTVMNIYSRGVFDTIVKWDEANRDVETNTIDRYLESKRALRVVVTDPFLVGHKEEQHSTIWGFQNTQYADLIAASSALLKEKISKYRARRGTRGGGG